MAGVLFVSIAAILWGTVGVANGLMVSDRPINPALIGMARTGLGAVSLLATARLLSVPRLLPGMLPLRSIAAFGLAGAVFQTCLFSAFVRVGVTLTVAVTVCLPVVLITVADAFATRRLPGAGVAAAIGIAVAGVLTALFGGDAIDPAGRLDAIGSLDLIVASMAFAVVAMAARTSTRTLHPLRAAGLGLAATTLVLMVGVAARPQLVLEAVAALPAGDLAIIAYTGVVATGGAYLAFVLGMHLSKTPASGLAATLIEPGVAAVLAAFVLQERLTAAQASGCALLLAAMLILFVAERRGTAAH